MKNHIITTAAFCILLILIGQTALRAQHFATLKHVLVEESYPASAK